MDVLDRTTRLDVVTATSTPVSAGPSSSPASDSKAPSFADSLSRPDRNSSRGIGDGSATPSTGATAAEASPQIPTAKANADVAPAASASSAVAKERKSAASPASPSRPIELESESSTTTQSGDAVDETLQVLVAELIAVATVAPPAAARVTNSDSPASMPPASLIAALQVPEDVPAAATPEGQQPLTPLPAIPAGLQIGLTHGNANAGSIADASLLAVQQFFPANPEMSAEQNVSSGAVTQSLPPAIQETMVEAVDSLMPAAVKSSSSTDSPPATHQAIQRPTSSITVPAPIATPVDDAARAQELTAVDTPPDNQEAIPRSTIPAGRLPSTDRQLSDESSRDDLTNFVTPVPSLTAFSLPNGTDRVLNRAVVKDSAVNSSPVDTMPIAAVAGQAPISLGVDPAALTVDSTSASHSASSAELPNVVKQLQPVLHQAMSQDRELTMTLRPPELGAVRIDVQHREGQMSARLHTETAAAHQLLTEQLPQLRDVLTQLGVASDQVQVIRSEASLHSAQTGFQTDRQTDAQQSGGRQESPQQHSPEPQRVDEPEREDSQRPAILTRTALNLRI